MKVDIFKIDGTQSGDKIKLKDNVFNVDPNRHLVHLAVASYLAAQRQGTHLARNRAMVTGSQKKPWRQKGTGRARAGTVKSPIWRGGGKSFGPHPHEYHLKINKKAKRVARRSALTYKAQDKQIFIIEDIGIDKPGTREVADLLNALNISVNDGRTMVVTKEYAPQLLKSSRNIKNLSISPAMQLSTYDIMRQRRLVIEKGAAELMNEAM